MNAREAYARLLELGLPIVQTSEVAALLRTSPGATTMTLTRLAASGLVTRLRPGQWFVGRSPDRYAIAEAVTAPLPSYVSLQTALYLHGMIAQVPATVYLVSLARTERITTSVATYSVHHITPELFDGYAERGDGTKLATPEKALFDVAYFSGSRARLFARLPELEMPSRFRRALLRKWISRVHAAHRRSMVERRLAALLERASQD